MPLFIIVLAIVAFVLIGWLTRGRSGDPATTAGDSGVVADDEPVLRDPI